MLLPESAFVASDGIDSDDTIWVLKNMPSEVGKDGVHDALKQAGWDAHPVRAQGQNRWLVAAKTEPASKHFCINGSFVLAEPIKRQRDSGGLVITAKQVKVDTVMMQGQHGTQIASTTRFQEVKAEISDQLEMKMQAANAKIEQLSSALEQFQAAQNAKDDETRQELAMVRSEQAFAKQKIDEVEASVVQSGQTVIQTMRQMMTQMQMSLESSMKQMLAQQEPTEDMKRQRKDQPERSDVFATKS
jgi:flagellar biosynthesis GTPase FlhF